MCQPTISDVIRQYYKHMRGKTNKNEEYCKNIEGKTDKFFFTIKQALFL
jgi:hypothetical protein